MKRISYKDLLTYNKLVCDKNNEESVVVNKDNLLSTLSVYDSYFETDEQVAAALFRSLIVNHGFQDGNKRTAVVCLFDILPPAVDDVEIERIALLCSTGKLRDAYDIADLLYGNDN